MSLAAGTLLGPYRIARLVGAGGMGEVYAAVDTRLDRSVAIKVLPEHFASDPERRKRFEREARAVSSLSHPHIAVLHDVGEHDGRYFIVMELVEGRALDEILSRGKLRVTEALAYASQIARALDAAHRSGIVHRDLKPANVMITSSGAKLLDFGLAKLDDEPQAPGPAAVTEQRSPLTAEGTVLGTAQYMAPEQLEGRGVDARADIFSFGSILYEMLTGERAFRADSAAGLAAAILAKDPPPLSATLGPEVPQALEHVVSMCLAKKPDDRWQTAGDVAKQLDWIGGSVSSPAAAPVAKKARPPKIWIAAGAALVIVVAVAAGVAFRGSPGGTAAVAPPPAGVSNAGATAQPPGAREVLPNSVAVLPFANLSPNANDAYFAQGIHEEVLNQLAKVSSLNVIVRTSVLRYADGTTPIPEIARELNVKTVMEGSVRYAGDNVRISVKLIDANTGADLWAEAYQRKFDDIFAIQADIAMNIANALRAEFSLEEQRDIERPLTTSADAYALFLQSGRGGLSPGERFALLDRAIALDPAFAAAFGRKAVLYSSMLVNTSLGNAVRPEERAEIERLLRASAERALAFDSREVQAQAALNTVDVQHWRWSTLRPLSAQQLSAFYQPAAAWAQAWKGDLAGILAVSERWAELDPNILNPFLNLGVLYAYAGDRSASDRALRRAAELGPRAALVRGWLAYNAAAAGNTGAALDDLARLERMLGNDPPIAFLADMAYAYGRIGRVDDARRLFERLEAAAKDRDIGTGGWALAYLGIGDQRRALEQLERAAEKARNHEPDTGYLQLMNLRMNYLADPIVGSPQFAEVLARIRGD
ncbi:MAG TPA: protein kinase [Gammaproteobacteria bacterium]|nr:protein kinase [Gammaproteobacteria bacterium]